MSHSITQQFRRHRTESAARKCSKKNKPVKLDVGTGEWNQVEVEGLDYSTPDHVKRLAVSVFAHRSIANAGSSGGNAANRKVEILKEILQSVPVPL